MCVDLQGLYFIDSLLSGFNLFNFMVAGVKCSWVKHICSYASYSLSAFLCAVMVTV